VPQGGGGRCVAAAGAERARRVGGATEDEEPTSTLGEEEACVCLMSASGEGQELTVGDGIRGAGVGLRADGEALAPVAGSGDRGGSNGEGHGEEMKRMKTAERGRG
jgi:hypothetical protein